MADIDIGAEATNRSSAIINGSTLLDNTNVANDTGTLDTIEIWASSALAGCKVGTFYEDGGATKYTARDSVTLGSVTQGSKQTFTVDSSSNPIALDVETGDLIGIYYSAGTLERDASGGSCWLKTGDQMSVSQGTFVSRVYILSVKATGASAGAADNSIFFGINF